MSLNTNRTEILWNHSSHNTTVRLSLSSGFPFTTRRSKRGICYGDMAGHLSITHQYCIKTAKPILKLFRPSGSPSF